MNFRLLVDVRGLGSIAWISFIASDDTILLLLSWEGWETG